jgi:hypothetical protein
LTTEVRKRSDFSAEKLQIDAKKAYFRRKGEQKAAGKLLNFLNFFEFF